MKALRAAGPALRRRLITRPTIPEPPALATVAYREEPAVLADVWAPEGADGSPTALIVHGGGFVGGSRTMSAVRTLVVALLERGFVVASIDYRLALPWTRIRLDEQVDDVLHAVRWWPEAAPSYGGDPDRTVLVGLSAGGALSLLAAHEARFDRYLGIYGAWDLTLLPARWASASMLVRSAEREEHDRRSPLHRATFAQPTLLIHGTEDPLTPPAHAERLLAKRREAGLPVDIHWVAGAQHGFLQDGLEHPHVLQTLDRIDRFLVGI